MADKSLTARRGFLRSLAGAFIAAPAAAKAIAAPAPAPLTPASYIAEMREAGQYFELMAGSFDKATGEVTRWWYFMSSDVEETGDQREAYYDLQHKYRRVVDMDFHERVRDLLVAELKTEHPNI